MGVLNIPEGKWLGAMNRRRGYVKGDLADGVPMTLIDTSPFAGIRKTGALITNTHLYARDPETNNPLKIEIASLSDIRVCPHNIVSVTETNILALGLPQDTMRGIARMLTDIRNGMSDS